VLDLPWARLQGDFQSWVALFNYFDDILEKHVSPRPGLQLDWPVDAAEQAPFPTSDVLAILRTSSIILENCANKHLYQSTEVGCFSSVFGSLQEQGLGLCPGVPQNCIRPCTQHDHEISATTLEICGVFSSFSACC